MIIPVTREHSFMASLENLLYTAITRAKSARASGSARVVRLRAALMCGQPTSVAATNLSAEVMPALRSILVHTYGLNERRHNLSQALEAMVWQTAVLIEIDPTFRFFVQGHYTLETQARLGIANTEEINVWLFVIALPLLLAFSFIKPLAFVLLPEKKCC